MNYKIKHNEGAGNIKFNLVIKELKDLLGSNYEVTVLDYLACKQIYYPDLALKIILDSEEKVNGIFFYNENSEFHQVLHEGVNLFELNYSDIKRKYKDFKVLEDSESMVVIDLGISFYFQDEKHSNPLPEEVGIFRSDMKEFYLNSYL